MKRNRSVTARKKLREAILSVLVLAIFFVPTIVAGWFFVMATSSHDTRVVTALPAFHARAIDQTGLVRPFLQGAVSVTFDDGWESIYVSALPLLQQYGFHSTQYIIANTLSNGQYMSPAQLRAFAESGSEIASHSASHANLTTLSAAELTSELKDSKQTLSKALVNIPIVDFASPYGAVNNYTQLAASQYYQSQVETEIDADPTASLLKSINLAGSFDAREIISYTVRSTTTLQTLQRLIDLTAANHAWLVLSYHQIDESTEEYSVSPAVFAKQLQLLGRSDLRGVTVAQFIHQFQAAEDSHE